MIVVSILSCHWSCWYLLRLSLHQCFSSRSQPFSTWSAAGASLNFVAAQDIMGKNERHVRCRTLMKPQHGMRLVNPNGQTLGFCIWQLGQGVFRSAGVVHIDTNLSCTFTGSLVPLSSRARSQPRVVPILNDRACRGNNIGTTIVGCER